MVPIEKVLKLSHKIYHALQKKLRRKKKRQLLAQARDEQEKLQQQKREGDPKYKLWEAEKQRNLELWEEFQERERIRKNKEWLMREEIAQIEFQRKLLLKQQEKERKEEEKKKMIAELEAKHLLVTSAKEEASKQKLEKEEVLQEALSGLPEKDRPWHNPMAPENYNISQQRQECLFFNKTGCCRFGERCSRGHAYPEVSPTILIKGMYSHFSMDQSSRDDYDTDMALEYEDNETYQDFKKFYEDVLPEFRKCGRVVQFKVCYNHEPHLRGNVYVQFSRKEYAVEAFKKFNGRFYAGKQLTIEFTNVIRWKAAICGLNESKRCPKGNNCNFLHAFQNPNDEFWAADRDLPDQDENRHSNSSHSNSLRSLHRDSYWHRSERDNYSYHHRRSNSSRSHSRNTSSSSRRHRYSSESDSSDDDNYSSRSFHEKDDDQSSSRSFHRRDDEHASSRSYHRNDERSSSRSCHRKDWEERASSKPFRQRDNKDDSPQSFYKDDYSSRQSVNENNEYDSLQSSHEGNENESRDYSQQSHRERRKRSRSSSISPEPPSNRKHKKKSNKKKKKRRRSSPTRTVSD